MSSLIEQAAKRLEQLRQAGVEIPHALPAGPSLSPSMAAPPSFAAPFSRAAVEPALPHAQRGPSSRVISLDLKALERAGIVTPQAPRSQIADQYRVIKRPLIRNAMGQGETVIAHGNLIMVTSAMSGEGKSFTSVNLAMSIATELDLTVMLVDADVARPSILRMLGLPPSPGLLDVLEGKVDMTNVLLKTNVDKLTLLPSGTPHPRATELLASDAMRHMLNDMATRYPDRIIIFDSPPLLLTTEARVLASHMGQVVVVVQADKTLQSDVQHALATIEVCPVRMMLLNRARAHAEGGYGYGYGGYGYGSSPRPAQEAAST